MNFIRGWLLNNEATFLASFNRHKHPTAPKMHPSLDFFRAGIKKENGLLGGWVPQFRAYMQYDYVGFNRAVPRIFDDPVSSLEAPCCVLDELGMLVHHPQYPAWAYLVALIKFPRMPFVVWNVRWNSSTLGFVLEK